MGFKADTSFLRLLSMGAAGARQLMKIMKEAGFEPIELERYSTSNKIWTTKVKRLRLPDILCVRTGLRVEVRAKSDLQIRMSDAPTNPDRRWDVGMRDQDLAAFIACADDNGTPVPATEPVFFTYRDLRASESKSRLGDPRAASEGTETARTWSSIVPKRNGVVTHVDDKVIRVMWDADAERSARSYTYQLRGNLPYVSDGDKFIAEASIIGGAPARRADLEAYLKKSYDPLTEIDAKEAVDRYAAVKALRFVPEKRGQAVAAIEQRLDFEEDGRVRLEAAATGTALESTKAWEHLEGFVWTHERADLRMEAVFILTELRNTGARDVLLRVTRDPRFFSDEIRQAAVWGLGKAGLKSYEDLVPFLKDSDRDVVLHAIAAFGQDAPKRVIDLLIRELLQDNPQTAPAASEALRSIGNDAVLESLLAATRETSSSIDWVLATLGRLPARKVRAALSADPLFERVRPLLLLSSSENWIAEDSVDIDLKFLLKQNL
ncbi:HEAT repeat domain-containing protein [Bradyrhizobium sp. STM 3562]|uniref:HEAT repeat domain-containing protein n=1 Tax=Bradyrhizobium sp. STM 3562 TaxID=578924 RepID=UPI00388D601A